MESESAHTCSFYIDESLKQTLRSCITQVLCLPLRSSLGQALRPCITIRKTIRAAEKSFPVIAMPIEDHFEDTNIDQEGPKQCGIFAHKYEAGSVATITNTVHGGSWESAAVLDTIYVAPRSGLLVQYLCLP